MTTQKQGKKNKYHPSTPTIDDNTKFELFIDKTLPTLKLGDIIIAYNPTKKRPEEKSTKYFCIFIKVENNTVICTPIFFKPKEKAIQISVNMKIFGEENSTYIEPSKSVTIGYDSFVSTTNFSLNPDAIKIIKKLFGLNRVTIDGQLRAKPIIDSSEILLEPGDIVIDEIENRVRIVVDNPDIGLVLLDQHSLKPRNIIQSLNEIKIDYLNPIVARDNLRYINSLPENITKHIIEEYKSIHGLFIDKHTGRKVFPEGAIIKYGYNMYYIIGQAETGAREVYNAFFITIYVTKKDKEKTISYEIVKYMPYFDSIALLDPTQPHTVLGLVNEQKNQEISAKLLEYQPTDYEQDTLTEGEINIGHFKNNKDSKLLIIREEEKTYTAIRIEDLKTGNPIIFFAIKSQIEFDSDITEEEKKLCTSYLEYLREEELTSGPHTIRLKDIRYKI